MAQHDSKTPKEFKNSFQTPYFIANWLDSQFNFDVDLAADDDNALCDNYFTLEQDSLKQDWSKYKCGFCNPPYDNIAPWIDRAVEEMSRGFVTVMLIPMCNGELHYRKVFGEASELLFIHGRISFIAACDWERKKPDGKIEYIKKGRPVSGNSKGSMVVVFEKKSDRQIVTDYMRTALEKKYG